LFAASKRIHMDASKVTAWLSKVAKSEPPQNLLTALQELRSRGFKANIVHHSVAASAYSKAHDWHAALGCICEVQQQGLESDAFICSAVAVVVVVVMLLLGGLWHWML